MKNTRLRRLSHRELVAECDEELIRARAADGATGTFFYLQEAIACLEEAKRRWVAMRRRCAPTLRVLRDMPVPPGRYGRQVVNAIETLTAQVQSLRMP